MLEFLRLLVRLRWPLRLMAPLFGRLNPYAPGYAEDPYPAYRRLREAAPVYRHPLFRAFVLSRYADVERMLKHPDTSVRRSEAEVPDFANPFRGLSPAFREGIGSTLLMLDPPHHTRVRNLVNKAFTPRVVESLRSRIQEVVDARLEALAEQAALGPVDLMEVEL